MGSWRLDGRFTSANGSLLRLIGYSRDEVDSGKVLWHQLVAPEYVSIVADALKETQSKGECIPFEMEIIHKDGHRIPVLAGGTIFDDGLTNAGAFFAVDLTESNRIKNSRQTEISSQVMALTDRQRAICLLLSYGNSEKKIAELLDLSVRTVESDKSSAAKQLEMPTSKLVIWSVENRHGLMKTFRGNHLTAQTIAKILGH
jgi:PAS domain S-box-containing protein